jgi:quinol monooxygenase YgiN
VFNVHFSAKAVKVRPIEVDLFYGALMAEDVELTMVTMVFDSSDAEALQSILAKYVVVSRGHPGCRNIDLCVSATSPGRFVVVQKWESPAAQQAHFDSDEMVEMATACTGLLDRPPSIDLLETISAHDLH